MKQLNVRHIRNNALAAIRDRLGPGKGFALRAVEREGDAVIVRVNSGGNALAVEPWLRRRGYRAEWDERGNPDGYGCAVRVTLPAPVQGGGRK